MVKTQKNHWACFLNTNNYYKYTISESFPKDSSKCAALKCFTNLFVNGKQRDLSLHDLAVMYCDTRLEVNKLSTVDHPNIVQLLGLCVVSYSILLEWAPKGNLNDIIDEYILADMWICPDAVAKTVYQVCCFISS